MELKFGSGTKINLIFLEKRGEDKVLFNMNREVVPLHALPLSTQNKGEWESPLFLAASPSCSPGPRWRIPEL